MLDTLQKHTLYIVATPIGHRDDLSARAVHTLRGVDRIYAEDTRHSSVLLRHHGINTRVFALHEHNEASRIDDVLEHLHSGGCAALISDAGTPLISDPGYRIVRACLQANLRVSPVPGPSALTSALSVSGLPTDRFQFVGFPPARSSARRQWILALAAVPHTLVVYESPHRILATLADLADVLGEQREMTLARELTKRFETILHGSIATVLSTVQADDNQQRGEFVLVIGGNPVQSNADTLGVDLDRLLQSLLAHMPVKTVARCAADFFGITRKQAYDRALFLQRKSR